ncbi:MAG: transposase [Nitrospirae bacterium]|nr:transposase [Nitrospirota bacterium]
MIHTWSQTLTDHFHLHCLVPGGVLTPDGQWKQARTKYLFRAQSMAALLKKNSTSAVCDCKDRIAGIDIAKCPHCGAGRMVTIRQLPRLPPPDTS